ncbi:MAG: flagellar hook-basal body complex protein FliE [Lachnospiraceae bacterium]|nr:flagellar hook-basal body complex protein FliE [Lachnospiraceae bacterium]
MDSMVLGINGLEALSLNGTSKPVKANKLDEFQLYSPSELKGKGKTASFDSLLQSAMDMISETNRYSNEAAEAELAYAMGVTNSTHELQVAQMKANVSLQYTVAVRNAVIDAYREIMQMQF